MADHTIEPDQTGAYNITIPAGETITINTRAQYANIGHTVRIFALTGTTPIYVRPGNTVEPGDPKATIIPNSTWADIWFATDGTIAATTEADATIAVARA